MNLAQSWLGGRRQLIGQEYLYDAPMIRNISSVAADHKN